MNEFPQVIVVEDKLYTLTEYQQVTDELPPFHHNLYRGLRLFSDLGMSEQTDNRRFYLAHHEDEEVVIWGWFTKAHTEEKVKAYAFSWAIYDMIL